jgi:hypothetical protein
MSVTESSQQGHLKKYYLQSLGKLSCFWLISFKLENKKRRVIILPRRGNCFARKKL